MAPNPHLNYIARRLVDPTEEEIAATVEAMNQSFGESFFLPVQNNDKALAKDLVAAQVKSALQYGEMWVAQLVDATSDNSTGIIGGACWYGRGQLIPFGNDHPNSPWELNMRRLDEGQPLVEYRGKKKSKGPIWWDKFYEAFDAMTDEGLGVGAKRAGYHLQLFGVHPDYQKQGVGTRLDKAVEEHVKATAPSGGATLMCLEALDADNVGVYEKMGYRVGSRGSVPAKDAGEEFTMPFVCMKKTVSA